MVKCEICGKEYEHNYWSNGNFCSDACFKEDIKRSYFREIHDNPDEVFPIIAGERYSLEHYIAKGTYVPIHIPKNKDGNYVEQIEIDDIEYFFDEWHEPLDKEDKGFGGRQFYILMQDGTVYLVDSLWDNGSVPQMYTNAVFVKMSDKI